jgi:hypothetical protein
MVPLGLPHGFPSSSELSKSYRSIIQQDLYTLLFADGMPVSALLDLVRVVTAEVDAWVPVLLAMPRAPLPIARLLSQHGSGAVHCSDAKTLLAQLGSDSRSAFVAGPGLQSVNRLIQERFKDFFDADEVGERLAAELAAPLLIPDRKPELAYTLGKLVRLLLRANFGQPSVALDRNPVCCVGAVVPYDRTQHFPLEGRPDAGGPVVIVFPHLRTAATHLSPAYVVELPQE